MKILVTGAAGFIGFHTAVQLLFEGHSIIGFDNLNDYYDVNLKKSRLREQGITGTLPVQELVASDRYPEYRFVKADLEDRHFLEKLFATEGFDGVINLAAQAGGRYSTENPHAYMQSNLTGFLNILESCRRHAVKHLVYASSSSVYGLNTSYPFSTQDSVDHPTSLYAASKKSNELMAHSYSHLFNLPTTGLRFFTVYGPWGRPDKVLFLFTKAILEDRPIKVFNYGRMMRDFTYVDDIVDGVCQIVQHPARPNPEWRSGRPDPATSNAPYRLYNMGRSDPVEIETFIDILERSLGKTAKKEYVPLQPGDMQATAADVSDLTREIGYHPRISVDIGVARFVEWYRSHYGVTG